MTFQAAELWPLSALQHYVFCPRQCALIHLELIWADNIFTAQGQTLHQKADSGKTEKRGDLKIATGLPLQSLTLGLSGQADVVEFHLREKQWWPHPVEYKRGRPKSHDADRVQLCAQAICLEEMLGLAVPEGSLFYNQTKRRLAVFLDSDLRETTRRAAGRMHQMLQAGKTPSPVADKRCQTCSLKGACLPEHMKSGDSSARYLANLRKKP